jgi:protein-S-isoprenylcysteine O-methyltransferase Ste14
MRDDRPGVLIWPPLLVGGAVLLGLLLDWQVPLRGGLETAIRLTGALLTAAAALLAFWAARRFRAAGTNIHPGHPATALVSGGPYRITRNPMYVGLVGVQVGLALILLSPWILILALPVAAILDLGVIRREERYLEAKFGEPYRAYRTIVRRWL